MKNTRTLKSLLTLLLLILFISINNAQDFKKNKYGLMVIDDLNTYETTLKNDSSNELIDIQKFIPEIKLDIRYATSNNFLGEPVYTSDRAFLRKPAAEALKNIQHELSIMGYGLKIFDAYRPYAATEKFYYKVKDTVYVASVWTGSRHNRGCAVDLTILNLKNGKELKMPTGFDNFTTKANSDYLDLSPEQLKNRDLLIGVMTKWGFNNYPGEWWHYDFKDWKKYPLMDLTFEELEKLQ